LESEESSSSPPPSPVTGICAHKLKLGGSEDDQENKGSKGKSQTSRQGQGTICREKSVQGSQELEESSPSSPKVEDPVPTEDSPAMTLHYEATKSETDVSECTLADTKPTVSKTQPDSGKRKSNTDCKDTGGKKIRTEISAMDVDNTSPETPGPGKKDQSEAVDKKKQPETPAKTKETRHKKDQSKAADKKKQPETPAKTKGKKDQSEAVDKKKQPETPAKTKGKKDQSEAAETPAKSEAAAKEEETTEGKPEYYVMPYPNRPAAAVADRVSGKKSIIYAGAPSQQFKTRNMQRSHLSTPDSRYNVIYLVKIILNILIVHDPQRHCKPLLELTRHYDFCNSTCKLRTVILESYFSKVHVKGATLDEHKKACTTLCDELTKGSPLHDVKLLANLMKHSMARKAEARAEDPAV